jgi:hypothetical protein
MKPFLFSSWGGRIVDNRGKAPGDREPLDPITSDPVPVPEFFKEQEKIEAVVGWDGIILRSENVDLLHLCKVYL